MQTDTPLIQHRIMTVLSKRIVRATTLIVLLSALPSISQAHCKLWHPHHCAADLVDWIAGGVEKRAKMVWHDPLGTLINPLKVIDESIPTPNSLIEYAIKNPNEIIELLENPVAGVIGLPLALAIADGRNTALRNGTYPMPDEIKTKLKPFFAEELLDSVRYATGAGLFNGIAQGVSLLAGANAVTLINVIVFKNKTGYSSPENDQIWAHELFHVRQYRQLGLTEFAATLTLSPSTNGAIEKPAYNFDARYGLIRDRRMTSSLLVRGLGDQCMAANGAVQGNRITMNRCIPSSSTQHFTFTSAGEIKSSMGLCVDVQWGSTDNRTPLHLWPCNQGKAQAFKLTDRGEIRSKLRNNLCVEAAGGRTTPGTPVQTYDCNGTASQIWIKPHGTLISAGSNQCLRADSNISSDLVRLAACEKTDPLQQWAMDGNRGRIKLSQFADRCLDVRGGNTNNGTPMQVYGCNGTASQIFTLTEDWQLKSALTSNLCLDVPGGDFSTTEPVQVYACNNTTSQQWNRLTSIVATPIDLPDTFPSDIAIDNPFLP